MYSNGRSNNGVFIAVFLGFLVGSLVIGLIALIGGSSTTGSSSSSIISKPPNQSHRSFVIPKDAHKISLNTYRIYGKDMSSYADIHIHKHNPVPYNRTEDSVKEKARKSANPINSIGPQHLNSQCYGPIVDGVRWRTTENFLIDTRNTNGLSSSFILNVIEAAINTWEKAAGENVIGELDAELLNINNFYSITGYNAIGFGVIESGDSSNVLAVTLLWYECTDYDSTANVCVGVYEYSEWKQIYDTVNYDWGDATDSSSVIDFLNVATHEFGHVFGLMDIYESVCDYVTMYGYTSTGETKKRTLSDEDIQGLKDLGYKSNDIGNSANSADDSKMHVFALTATIVITLLFV